MYKLICTVFFLHSDLEHSFCLMLVRSVFTTISLPDVFCDHSCEQGESSRKLTLLAGLVKVSVVITGSASGLEVSGCNLSVCAELCFCLIHHM